MKNTSKLMRLNLHLRPDHINRLTYLADRIAERKGRETRLAEALELVLDAGLTWADSDLLDCVRSDSEQPRWLALGPVIRTR